MKKPYAFLGIIVTLALIVFWVYLPIFSRYRELKLEEERMVKDIADIDSKIQALEEERDLLKSDVDYLEKVIRHEFGLVRPGEIVYKFIPKREEKKPAAAGASVSVAAVAAPSLSPEAGKAKSAVAKPVPENSLKSKR